MLKKTPLYEEHLALGAKMVEFGGYEMPVQYTSIIEEHMAVRTGVGIFDVSHMGEILVEGPNAANFLNKVLSNDIYKLKPNKIQYNVITFDYGGTLEDLLVYQLAEGSYLLVVNASNTGIVYDHLSWLALGDVEVKDVSDTLCLIAVQGPQSFSAMTNFPGADKLKPFTFGNWDRDGHPLMVSRTGYTGEDGYEIYGPPEAIKELFREYIDRGVKPCGLGARDTLRFEAGLSLYGHELGPDITPVEAGLEKFIKLDKIFPGSEILVRQVEEGTGRRLVGLRLLERGVPRQGYKVFCQGEEVGHVTSGNFAPYLKEYLAMALVDVPYASRKIFEIQIRGKRLQAEAVPRNFLLLKKEDKNE